MIRAIALDDEPIALSLLQEYATRVPLLQLESIFTDPFAAIQYLQRESVDLLFLDIQMPDLSGLQFLKTIQRTPPVIFTTAYSQYAVDGFNLDAIDYLLKPFDFERFVKAVNKAVEYLNYRNAPKNSESSGFIFVKSEYQLVKIDLAKVLYLEGYDDYVKIYTHEDKPLLSLMSLKAILEKLPPDSFLRVHRSYIVQLSKIGHIQRNRIYIEDKIIPIGEAYAEAFYKRINS